MKRLAAIFVVHIFANVALFAEPVDVCIARFTSEDEGGSEETTFHASLARLSQAPSWNPLAEEVPLSPTEAVTAAVESLRKDHRRSADYRPSTIQLRPYWSRSELHPRTFWFYVVTLYRAKRKGSETSYQYDYICVLLDGSVVKPRIRNLGRAPTKPSTATE